MKPPMLRWDAGPLVVGTITTREGLARWAEDPDGPPCDVVEIRLDRLGVGAFDWRGNQSPLPSWNRPILLTLRHADEGGDWSGAEGERKYIYRAAARWISAVDIEVRSRALPALRQAIGPNGPAIIASYHHFSGLPPAEVLDRIIRVGLDQGADIVKIAVWLADDPALQNAARLLQRFPGTPLAVVGMGPLGPASRISLPRAGSVLTYGYLDESAAPGQISAAWLRRRMGPGSSR